MTGSGQTYVVVQDGDNISFVPAEMVQGDVAGAVNGGQVEGLDPVEQQLAQSTYPKSPVRWTKNEIVFL